MKKIIAISIIIFLTIIGVVWYLNSQLKYIDREGVYLHNYRDMGDLEIKEQQTFKINQQISPSRNDLANIFVALKISEPINLNFVITDLDNNLVRKKTIAINEVLGYIQFVTWDFEPIINSLNQTYNFTITGQTQNSSLTFYTVAPDKYDGGTLTVNGLTNNDERIIVDWQYPSENIWKTVIYRLAYAKPGLFNYPTTYLILFILLGILSFIVIFLFTQLLIK